MNTQPATRWVRSHTASLASVHGERPKPFRVCRTVIGAARRTVGKS